MDFPQARDILSRFGIDGSGMSLMRVSGGYINDTFKLLKGPRPVYILQRINTDVFGSPELLMENITRMLPYLHGPQYKGLQLCKTSEGGFWTETKEGQVWRLFQFVPGSVSLTATDQKSVAKEAGRILGTFHQLASKAPLEALHSTLPRFHNLAWRTAQLEEALKNGVPNRIGNANGVITRGRELAEFCRKIPFDQFPVRICHNDTKLSNILFDSSAGKALCLIDLDTLMPGYLLYDFGAAARTLICEIIEDSPESEKIQVSLPMYEAFLRGWKESGFQWNSVEGQWLAHGVVLMPFLHGVRALADYLMGDQYYKTSYDGQNLNRAQNLLTLAEKARTALPEMQEIYKKVIP